MRNVGYRDSALFITSQSNFESELGALETAWFEIIINSILAGKQNTGVKTWVILDELAGAPAIISNFPIAQYGA